MPNRYVCTVLDEMRSCFNSRNFAYLESLIEEVQVMVNRMEAHLRDAKDIDWLQKEKRELKREIKELEQKKQELEDGK
jgi:cell shape-determining protein MreC